MEIIKFEFEIAGQPVKRKRTVAGVVGSGNLEVIVTNHDNSKTYFTIQTSVENHQHLWAMVINDFIREYQPAGINFTINDNGATPAVVALRLRQAWELFSGHQRPFDNYLELDARARIAALTDENSFKEWFVDSVGYSPHLAALGLPGEADDGLVVGTATLLQRKVIIAAQQKDFMGGGVGEIHGAKLNAAFQAAIHLNMSAVILLVDSGGVRLHEANAGEIAISEIIRSIFAARHKGIMTLGVICGKNGAFGGMGIISACLDHIIINQPARIGVSGPEVIQAVKGVEAFDAQDRGLVWRVYGGKTRFLQGAAHSYAGTTVKSIADAIYKTCNKQVPIDLTTLKQQQALLQTRLTATEGFQEEGAYLQQKFPAVAATIFNMNEADFLQAVNQIHLSSEDKQ